MKLFWAAVNDKGDIQARGTEEEVMSWIKENKDCHYRIYWDSDEEIRYYVLVQEIIDSKNSLVAEDYFKSLIDRCLCEKIYSHRDVLLKDFLIDEIKTKGIKIFGFTRIQRDTLLYFLRN